MKDAQTTPAGENPLGSWLSSEPTKNRKKPRFATPGTKKPRKPRVEREAQIQKAFIQWKRLPSTLLKYPLLEKLLFSVPNGGYRSPKTASQMIAEGVEKGVSDLLFLVPAHGYSYLSLEFKAPKGTQSKDQKDFEKEVDSIGGIYQLCYSVEEAKSLIAWYYSGISKKL